MTSEARAPLGAPGPVVGDHIRGRLAASVCHLCSHAHEYIASTNEGSCSFVGTCWCKCTAGETEYRGIAPIIEFKPRTVADVVAPFRRHDDDLDDGPKCAHGLDAGGCVGLRTVGDTTGVRGVEPGGDMRRGRLDWLKRLRISRLAGDQRDELVGERGNE